MGMGSSEVGTPLPPWSTGISRLEGNCEVIYGAQLLRGKILHSKNLVAHLRKLSSKRGRISSSEDRHGLDDHLPSGLWSARADVTHGFGKLVWKSAVDTHASDSVIAAQASFNRREQSISTLGKLQRRKHACGEIPEDPAAAKLFR
jgi:hypothetical protein